VDDLIAIARRELALLERQLQRLRTREQELRAFIKVGSELRDAGAVSAPEPVSPLFAHSDIGIENIADEHMPVRVRAVRGAKIILGRAQPKTARQMIAELAAMGVHIGGQDPPSNLAAILSKTPGFRNIRGQGYFLVEPEKTEPVGGQTPTGSERLDLSDASDWGATAIAAD
jgi:hypothetical protein